jgi:hypothetical protein
VAKIRKQMNLFDPQSPSNKAKCQFTSKNFWLRIFSEKDSFKRLMHLVARPVFITKTSKGFQSNNSLVKNLKICYFCKQLKFSFIANSFFDSQNTDIFGKSVPDIFLMENKES